MISREHQVSSTEVFPRSLRKILEPEYTLIRTLGSGAFGDVFEARQTSTGQSVAVKVLRATDRKNAQQRFLREMRACAALHHPHVVRVLDAGREAEVSDGPVFYTVFEYVPGRTLAELLAAEGMLPVQTAVRLMEQVLDALQAAHRIGIVHRDLKPTNVMVSDTGAGLHAKILDFGISGWIDNRDRSETALTQSGERVGTPAYCAPEQLRGEKTSPLFDYYAWGLVLLECLTGEHPFGHRTMHEVFHAQFSPDPVPIPAVIAQHPLGDLLRWTLEKDPTRRASNADHLLTRLGRLNLSTLADDAGFLLTSRAPETGRHGSPATEVSSLTPASSERRPLTVLCCRIALARALPPDEADALDEWLADLWETIAQIAQRGGGRLTDGGGSEFFVYFGLERSGEASARSAARTVLEIRDQCSRRAALMRARAGWAIDMHFGLHHGMVTVGTAPEQKVSRLSTTASIASRTCQLAPPNDIAATEPVVNLLLGLKKFERQSADTALGSLSWYCLSTESSGAGSADSDDTVVRQTVGRTDEVEKLGRVWQRESGFSHRCVVLQGEAGIGKTHLASLWNRRLAADGCVVMTTRCFPETGGISLYPILLLLTERLGLRETPPEQAAEKIGRFLVEQGLDQAPHQRLLCEWLGLPFPAATDLPLSPKKKREQVLALLVKLVGRLVPSPNVLFIEDIHWADPTTLEWLQLLLAADAEPRPLLSCTLRTEESLRAPDRRTHAALDGILSHPSTLTIELGPLSEESAYELLDRVGCTRDEAKSLVLAGLGIPFYLLELVRCGHSTREFVVPSSIAELLRIRMDQLGNAKETAQLAAVVGPEFEYELLCQLSRRGSELLGDLNRLQNAGVIITSGDGLYAFAHALLRDSAYRSLPLKDRQRLHGGIAAFLVTHHPEVATSKPWLLALHFFHAGETARALSYGESAATQAMVRFDNLETLGYVRDLKGYDTSEPSGWLRKLDEGPERAGVELRLVALEATALMLTRGWADPELSKACRRASDLFDRVPAAATLQMRYVLAQYFFSTGWSANPDTGTEERARPRIDALIDAATSCNVPSFRSLGCMMLSALKLFQGEIAASLGTARSVEPFENASTAWQFGYDAQICARSIESQALWLQGDDRASAVGAETLKLAEALGHPATLANAQLYSLTELHLSGDRSATARRCDELVALCERAGIQGFPAYAMIFKGWAVGDPGLARGAFEALIGAGQRLCEVYCRTIVAEAELDAGNGDEAEKQLAAAEDRAVSTGERFSLPHVLLLRARCLDAQDAAGADRLVTCAVDLATQQGAHGLAVRIASEGARLRSLRLARSRSEHERRPDRSET